MDIPDKPPLVLANRIIDQLANHLFGEEAKPPEAKDFTVIRTTFRSLKGSWEQLVLGNIQHMNLLMQVVTAWGKRRPQQPNPEVV